MDFLDEDAKPRFVLQSKTPDQSSAVSGAGRLSKPILAATIVFSTSLLIFSLFFLHSEPWKSLLLWLSLSLLLGPIAPPSLTAGDIRVGGGPAVNFPSPADSDDNSAPPPEKKPRSSRSHRRPEDPAPAPEIANPNPAPARSAPKKEEEDVWEEKEWIEEEIEVLKKQLVKNPAGKPGRWESIAESFRGRHGVESVIRKAKELGERKSGSGGDSADSYSEFLRRRKPSEKKALAEHDITEPDRLEMGWSSGEDIALLNALKAFPKEAAMRWEKVAAALPGRSKAECVKRVADLKKGFRDSKKNNSD